MFCLANIELSRYVHLFLSMIIVPLSALAFLLVIMFIRTEKSSELQSPASWMPINQTLWLGFLISLPIVFVLLFFGEPHATTDEIGVLIAITHCFYLPFVLSLIDTKLNQRMICKLLEVMTHKQLINN